jgi:hypothetical protein
MGIFRRHNYDPSTLLYDSDEDGLNFRILQQALLGFWGPTVLVVRTAAGDCLGYYTRLPWKVSTNFYTFDDDGIFDGDDDPSFLFRLSPYWNKYRMVKPPHPRSRRFYHQLLNVEPRNLQHGNTRQQCPLRGLAVGGVSHDSPRLHLTESLDMCRCSPVDAAFDPGNLLGTDDVFFDADRILLFAVCDDGTRRAAVAGEGEGEEEEEGEWERGIRLGRRQVRQRESDRVRAARVDRAQFVDDVAVLAGAFGHRDQARGRGEFAAMDDASKGYYVVGKPPSARALGGGRNPDGPPTP